MTEIVVLFLYFSTFLDQKSRMLRESFNKSKCNLIKNINVTLVLLLDYKKGISCIFVLTDITAKKQYKQYNAVKLAASTLIISTKVNTALKVFSKNGAL